MWQGIKLTLSDFELNRPLDDALFRLDVPEGYKIRKMDLDIPADEELLVGFLHAYAETADDAFPPKLDDWAAIGKHFADAWQKGGKTDNLSDEAVQLTSNVAGIGPFLLTKQYGYHPDGAKLGDAGQIIFWYKPAEGEKYRALYADLHWSDVSPAQLPKQPDD